MSTRTPILTLNKLKKNFVLRGQGVLKAVEDISLTVYRGEKLGIVGESGCGKSTLGRVILQLHRQTSGAAVYYGKTLQEVNPRYLAREIKKLPRYQRKAKDLFQKSLETDLRARALTMRKEEHSAEGSFRDARAFRRFSRKADLLSFRAWELRKEASRQLREGSRTVGSLILSRDLPQVCQHYREANLALRQAHDANQELIRLGKLRPQAQTHKADKSTQKIKTAEAALATHMQSAQQAMNAAEAFLHQNISPITERCFDPLYWEKLDANRETGINLGKLSAREMREVRRDMQMIFQDPAASLDPRQTVGEAIGETFRIHTRIGKQERKERVLALLSLVGLKPEHYDAYPHQMSGGQKQRVGIARAIALHPQIIVLDESLSALDVSVQAQVLQLLNDLQEEFGLTYFFITHNLGVVRHFCDRVMVMYLGGMCELAPAKELFSSPKHPYTVSLLASVPRLDPAMRQAESAPLQGEVPSALRPPSGCRFHTRCERAMPICAEKKPLPLEVSPDHLVACHLYDPACPTQGETAP